MHPTPIPARCVPRHTGRTRGGLGGVAPGDAAPAARATAARAGGGGGGGGAAAAALSCAAIGPSVLSARPEASPPRSPVPSPKARQEARQRWLSPPTRALLHPVPKSPTAGSHGVRLHGSAHACPAPPPRLRSAERARRRRRKASASRAERRRLLCEDGVETAARRGPQLARRLPQAAPTRARPRPPPRSRCRAGMRARAGDLGGRQTKKSELGNRRRLAAGRAAGRGAADGGWLAPPCRLARRGHSNQPRVEPGRRRRCASVRGKARRRRRQGAAGFAGHDASNASDARAAASRRRKRHRAARPAESAAARKAAATAGGCSNSAPVVVVAHQLATVRDAAAHRVDPRLGTFEPGTHSALRRRIGSMSTLLFGRRVAGYPWAAILPPAHEGPLRAGRGGRRSSAAASGDDQ